MCGIAGFQLQTGRRAEQEDINRMMRALAHRGPDDQGVHLDGPLALAQTRLSIIGLETGHQPMLSPADGYALVANGEVYNYLELNAALRQQGRTARTSSDSETIMHAYAVHGLDMLIQLRGMYAFALHDARRKRLILARDRLGIKPLFYVRLADRIAFASEIKALLSIIPQAPALDATALRRFLLHQFSAGRRTCVRGIQRVLPGEALVIDEKCQVAHHRYWSPLEVEPRELSAEEATEELDAMMTDAMREHMRSDVPFGVFLSGGTDSAVLTAMLDKLGAHGLKTYSVGFRDTEMSDEIDAAQRIASHFATEHQVLRLDRESLIRRIPHSVWAADELMRDYACLPTSILAQQAGAELKVVFSGEGGDEVFAGYRRYRPPLAERWLKAALHPGSGGFRTRSQWSGRWVRSLFGSELRQAMGDREPFLDAWQETPAGWSDMKRRQYTDILTALPDNLLVKTDRMLMAFGLEGRVPFLDHRLVELGLSLPDGLKARGRDGKWLLKRWAEPLLPAGHLQSPKRGFHVPMGDWLTGELAEQIGHRLVANRSIWDWFDTSAIPALVAARQAGRGGTRELFGLMQIAIWHQLFVEQPGSKPLPEDNLLDWISPSP
ncbi:MULTISPECIES: asparagine synthase (glutamine-hydrolyzing) [Thiorhodovibrio]|uniref:asparagine synthase (glutamine-hydrolyzing) n=1 Tax=Thiorhodovibrio TaxID=61593 RepID=UPI001913D542|nr:MULTISPECIES: asparagine synthase (glutamine-hydrolyzing) [Thiorhodovibrio]MBK5970233.1 asparagine synthase (glutamine-hydrolyzing) [Thiorhodovibrio winogradskyi]WPL12737.1 Asparagine synthetase [glutamine-hydrolyzing] 1 [Thiorhodovibrio litoralis]